MKAIVTGKFEAEKQATRAVDKLLRSCVPCDHVRTFLVNPSRWRTAYPVGGNCKKSARAGKMNDERIKATAVAGAIGLEVRPAATADGVGVSAYIGSLADALGKLGEEDKQTTAPPAGILVAVETSDHISQILAVSVLRRHGARVIERAAGPWQDGKWPGFDPVPLSSVIDEAAAEGKSQEAALLRPKLNSHRPRLQA